MSEFLTIHEVSKSYGAVRALKGVSFSVGEGEIHAILGENGAGKSTLVKIINGEVKPDEGAIFLNGRKLEIRDPKQAQNLGISMVHQELSIFENLTVAENIFPRHAFTTKLGLIKKRELLSQAQEKLSLFGLDIHPGEKLVNLSLAEQQVVEILRAISREPEIVILDEPTSGLKRTEVEDFFRILKKLRDTKITVLYISHRIQEVL
jgi:ribose transport system ATP-binding protein